MSSKSSSVAASSLKPTTWVLPYKTQNLTELYSLGRVLGQGQFGLHTHHRSSIVNQINQACRKFSFFQVTNHGIPLVALDRTISAIKAFHERPTEVKTRVYRRDTVTGVNYASNFDLYSSKAASWRDTLVVRLGPMPANPLEVPEICPDAVAEWDQE
ncbi:hypothetical protein ACFX1Q_030433 [Malus domestica]